MDEKEKAELAETIAEAAATAVADSIETQFFYFTEELTRKLRDEIYELKQQLDRAATQAARNLEVDTRIIITHITNEIHDLRSKLQQ